MKNIILPKIVMIPKSIIKDKQYNAVTDYLSDMYGFCINNFNIERKNGKIYAVNINWDITD